MLGKKLILSAVAITLIAPALLLGGRANVGAQEVVTSPKVLPDGVGFDGAYRYRVTESRSGRSLRGYVQVDFTKEDVAARYAAANRALAMELPQQGASSVPVTVTFRKPLSLTGAQEIVEGTGMQLTSYWLGATKPSAGKAAIFRWPADHRIEDYSRLEAEVLKPRQYTLKDVMVLVGEVDATPRGLGALLNDQRVHLLDVVAHDVRRQAEGNLGDRAKDLVVAVRSPYWHLDW